MEKLAHEGRPMAPATEGKASVSAERSPNRLRSLSATVAADAFVAEEVLWARITDWCGDTSGNLAVLLAARDTEIRSRTIDECAERMERFLLSVEDFPEPFNDGGNDGFATKERQEGRLFATKHCIKIVRNLASSADTQSSTSPAPTMGEV